jgi:pentatricopeptide repeat protein
MLVLTHLRTHIRPLLRLQSHAHQPDLFTSNPSLLHHFQPAGVSNSLVAAGNAQTASGASGATGGAGRSGYSGASSGGGYTGHARAFLSLPQGPGADASSLSASAEEKKESAAAARQRAHLALKQRIAAHKPDDKTTRVVMVRDNVMSRASRPLKLVDIDASAAAEDAPKRSSIAYPAWAALPADAAPGGALWLPGAAPRPPTGARAFHSRASRPLLVTVGPAPQHIEQPNRVLMDLAGLDMTRPMSPPQQRVRRNSTASVVRPSSAAEFVPEIEVQGSGSDKDIYDALATLAADNGPAAREVAVRLIEHYRTPRGTAPTDAELAAQYPLPASFTTGTYNACLQALLQHRNRGESIAPILDIYNEMLERDVVPNFQTTVLVIQALCLREEDVAAASRRWAQEQEWKEFKLTMLGIEQVEAEGDRNATAAIRAYQAESNLASAIQLYKVATTFYPGREKTLAADILTAAAATADLSHSAPDNVVPIIMDALKAEDLSTDIYASIFDILAALGPSHKDLILSTWKQYLAQVDAAAHKDNRFFNSRVVAALVACGEVDEALSVIKLSKDAKYARTVQSAALSALATAGHIDSALKIFHDANGNLAPTEMLDLAQALALTGRFQDTIAVMAKVRDSATELPGQRIRNRTAQIVGAALAHVRSAESAEVRVALYDDIYELTVQSQPALDSSVLTIYAALAIEAGKLQTFASLLSSHTVNLDEQETQAFRALFTDLVYSQDATLPIALDLTRAFARFNIPLASEAEAEPSISQRIIELYCIACTEEGSVAKTMIYADRWFRLCEALVSLPPSFLESGAADDALVAFFQDVAAATQSGSSLPWRLPASPVTAELADILAERVGAERATELLTSAFDGRVAATLLPAPTPAFTLPPTPSSTMAPPSNFQPTSAHTLHISPKLDQLIDRLVYPTAAQKSSPERVYATIRTALTKDNEVPSPEGIGRLISALARAGDEPKARELYSLAQVVLASCIAEPAVQAEGWRIIEDSMISACCFMGHLEQAGMHRARIIEAGMVPSADSYATMIASSRDSTDEALVARELFDESQAMGVVPHLYLYNTIISKLSKARKAELSLELFSRMKAEGIRPSSVTYGAVINACSRVGDAESAATLFDEMSAQRNFRPRVPPFK